MRTIELFRQDLITAPGHRLPIRAAFRRFQSRLMPSELSTATIKEFVSQLRESGEIVGKSEGKSYLANRLLANGLYVNCGNAIKKIAGELGPT